MPKPLTLEQKCLRFPPVACRLLARKRTATGGIEPLTDSEIAASSGFPVPEISRLSQLTSWMEVPVSKMLAFTRACGIDFDSRDSLRLHTAYLGQSSLRYLRKRSDWETKWAPLVKRYIGQ